LQLSDTGRQIGQTQDPPSIPAVNPSITRELISRGYSFRAPSNKDSHSNTNRKQQLL
jgi:hypothetical protein